MIRSTAIQRSRKLMFGCARALASSASWMALPVASAACAMRRTAWPPSRVRCRPSGPLGSAEKGTPCATSHSTAIALRSAMKRAVCSSTRPAPASCVSRTCESTLSSSPSTPTMPPCAQAVAPSSSCRFASTTTGRSFATSRATASPARPAPTMTTGSVLRLELADASDMARPFSGLDHSPRCGRNAKCCTGAAGQPCWIAHPGVTCTT